MADTTDVIVQFIKHHKSYNAGDRANFPRAAAQDLVDRNIAKPAKKGSIFKRGKKADPSQRLEPGSKVRFFIPKEGDATGIVINAPSGKGPVQIEYDGEQLELPRAELTFIAGPAPEPEIETPKKDETPQMVAGTPVRWGEGTDEVRGLVVDPRDGSDTVVVNYGESDIEIAREKLTIITDDGQGEGDGSDAGDDTANA